MNPKRTQALELRKAGKTYAEIGEVLGVAKSTLSFWLKNEEGSHTTRLANSSKNRPLVQERLNAYNTKRSADLVIQYQQAEREAEAEFSTFQHEPLFLSGLSLYLGQGDKNAETNAVRISSIDPAILKIFIRFCKHYLKINDLKVRFWPLLYENSNISEACEWWRGELGLNIEQFYKPQVIKGKQGEQRLLYGVGNIIIGSKLHKVKLLEWVKLARAVLAE